MNENIKSNNLAKKQHCIFLDEKAEENVRKFANKYQIGISGAVRLIINQFFDNQEARQL